MNSIVLRSGAKMPIIGFGTFTGMKTPQDAYKATLCAIESGYRHIDTAQFYGTEKYVGQAIKDSGINRKDIFVNSKIYNTCYSKDLVQLQMQAALEALQLDYLDSWLMHTPWALEPLHKDKPSDRFQLDENKKPMENKSYDLLETWNAISELCKKGLVRDIGVSNFNTDLVDYLIKNGDVAPSVNQVESHPYLNNDHIRKHHSENGVVMTAYGPLGGPGETSMVNGITLLEHPISQKIAKKHNKSPGQILIKFQVQRGVAVIPKSVTPSRIASNIDIFDFELSEDEIKDLLSMNGPHRAYPFDRAGALNPKHGPNEVFA